MWTVHACPGRGHMILLDRSAEVRTIYEHLGALAAGRPNYSDGECQVGRPVFRRRCGRGRWSWRTNIVPLWPLSKAGCVDGAILRYLGFVRPTTQRHGDPATQRPDGAAHPRSFGFRDALGFVRQCRLGFVRPRTEVGDQCSSACDIPFTAWKAVSPTAVTVGGLGFVRRCRVGFVRPTSRRRSCSRGAPGSGTISSSFGDVASGSFGGLSRVRWGLVLWNNLERLPF